MYIQLKRLKKQYNYNSLLIQSILTTVLGSHILGGIAWYNITQLGTDLIYYNAEPDDNIKNNLIARCRRCKVLLSIGWFVVALKYFFLFITLWGMILTMNENLNANHVFL